MAVAKLPGDAPGVLQPEEPGAMFGKLERNTTPNLSSIAISREAALKWVNDEVQAQASCKSLPLTFFFWLVFMLTAFGHRQIGTAFELQSFIKVSLTSALSPTVTASGITGTTGTSGSSGVGTGGGTVVRRLVGVAKSNIPKSKPPGIGLDEVTTPLKIYDWIERTLVRLAWSSMVDGNSYVSYFNRVVGGARLMQTRLEKDDCPGNDNLVHYFDSVCYSLDRDRNKTSLGNSTGFTADDDGVYVYWFDIHNTEDEVLQHLDFLRNANWLSSATQDIRVQIVFYNDQVALFTFAEVLFRLEPSGKLKASTTIKVLPTEVYDSMITIMGDVLMGFLLFWLFIGECFKIYGRRKERAMKIYFKNAYTYVNWAVVFFGVGLAGFWIYLVVVLDRVDLELQNVKDPPESEYTPGTKHWDTYHDRLDTLYNSTEKISRQLSYHDLATFFFSMVVLFKFFEAFSANPRLAVLTETFLKAYVDFSHFMIVFLTIFINFALGGNFIFGHHLEEWSNLVLSHITSFRALMGDFSFAEMYRVAPISATIWFTSFMILVFMVLLNMSLAIVLDVYADVKEQARNETTLWGQAMRFWERPSTPVKIATGTELLTIKDRLQTLGEEEGGYEHVTIEDLIRIGIPKGLAKDMAIALHKKAAEEAPPQDRPKVEEVAVVSSWTSPQQPAPQPAAASLPSDAGDLDSIVAGMRVLLEKLEFVEESAVSQSVNGDQGVGLTDIAQPVAPLSPVIAPATSKELSMLDIVGLTGTAQPVAQLSPVMSPSTHQELSVLDILSDLEWLTPDMAMVFCDGRHANSESTHSDAKTDTGLSSWAAGSLEAPHGYTLGGRPDWQPSSG